MVGKLGIVMLCLAALTACTPGEHKGRVIAGLNENGTLVAVLGTCDDDEIVELDIFEDSALVSDVPPDSTLPKRLPQWFAKAEHPESTAPMRIELPRDRAPEGWSSSEWKLPDQGKVVVYVRTLDKPNGPASQYLQSGELDMAALLPLPPNAEDLATEDC